MSNKKIGVTLLIVDVLCILFNAANAVLHAAQAQPQTFRVILYSICTAMWIVCTVLHCLTYFKNKI